MFVRAVSLGTAGAETRMLLDGAVAAFAFELCVGVGDVVGGDGAVGDGCDAGEEGVVLFFGDAFEGGLLEAVLAVEEEAASLRNTLCETRVGWE